MQAMRGRSTPHSAVGARQPLSGFVDRENECRSLEHSVLKRESRWIPGAAGTGKTALVSKVIGGLPPDLAARCIYLSSMKDLLPREAEQAMRQDSHFFYWGDRERLALGPLHDRAAGELLESSIKRFGLSQFDHDGFRDEILELSKQIPGAIVKMCALAADPRYRYESRIKIKSVYIDHLVSGHRLKALTLPSRAGTSQ
jgi:hypothetical protein